MKKNKQEVLSKAVGALDMRYLKEAECYDNRKKKNKYLSFLKQDGNDVWKALRFVAAAAATVVLCVLIGSIGMVWYSGKGLSAGSILPFGKWFSSEEFQIKAYAYETGGEITSAGVMMDTGSIQDTGEQKGHPLMFYLSGKDIKMVRFSCEKQQISFRDWTEQRDEYSLAQNFTIPYGEKSEEYKYLTIDWEPQAIIEALNAGSTIATLPEELREDRIVMEITGLNGETAVKMIRISLLEDGRFLAAFEDYTIQEDDTFVQQEDDISLREQSEKKLEEIRRQEEEAKKQEEAIEEPKKTEEKKETEKNKEKEKNKEDEIANQYIQEAEAAARDYYAKTVFEVVSLEATEVTEKQVIYSVMVTKGSLLQEPNRTIVLEWQEESWKVTNEGY